MSAVEERAMALLERIEVLAGEAGPAGLDLAVSAVRMKGSINLLAAALVLALIAFVGLRVIPGWIRAIGDYGPSTFEEARIAVGVMASLIFGLAGILTLLDTENWMALLAPELALAMKLLG